MKVTHAWGPRFPKSVLHEFYQQNSSVGIPVFSIESGPRPPALPSFTCTLTIPAVQTAISGYDETTFTAWSRSKKSAEHAAAEKALAFLVSKGLLQPPANPDVVSLNARGWDLEDISKREVIVNQERLLAMSSEAAIGSKTAVRTTAVLDEEDEALDLDVDSLSRGDLQIALKKAQEANVRLKSELTIERKRRLMVLKALIQSA